MALLAARALTTAMDSAPQRAAAALVGEGAPAVLCAEVLAVRDIDVVEQCVRCLHLLAAEEPRALLAAGALRAVLAHLEFFPQARSDHSVEGHASL